MRAVAPVLAVVAVLLTLTGCSSAPVAAAQSSADSCRGSGCAATLAPQPASPATTAAAAATPAAPENVTVLLSVSSVRGDFGGYIVNLHDGNPAKQTTFNVDRNGKWSTTITVPNESMVKLDIARIGATCEIRNAGTGRVLISDENSCIVGS